MPLCFFNIKTGKCRIKCRTCPFERIFFSLKKSRHVPKLILTLLEKVADLSEKFLSGGMLSSVLSSRESLCLSLFLGKTLSLSLLLLKISLLYLAGDDLNASFAKHLAVFAAELLSARLGSVLSYVVYGLDQTEEHERDYKEVEYRAYACAPVYVDGLSEIYLTVNLDSLQEGIKLALRVLVEYTCQHPVGKGSDDVGGDRGN